MTVFAAYFSPTGGVQHVVEALMKGFEEDYQTIDFLSRKEEPVSQGFNEDDWCVVAVPVYGGRVAYTAYRHILEMQGNGAKAIAVAVFGNRAIDDALLELKDLLEAQGFVCMAGISAVAEHSIMRMYGTGRPDEADQEELVNFVKEVLEESKKDGELQVPGNVPYREYDYHGSANKPIANDQCIECMICANECPENAISVEDVHNVIGERCIACLHCISVCPVQARTINWEAIQERAKQVEEVFGPRKPNELFVRK